MHWFVSSCTPQCDSWVDLFTSDPSTGLVQAHMRMHHQISSSHFPLWYKSHLPATVVSDVWFEGSLSVRKRDKQTHLFSQNYKVEFICVLFVCCLMLCLFLLKLFALQNRLRKGWFPASWSVSLLCFCVFQPRIPLAKVCSCRLCKALSAFATSTFSVCQQCRHCLCSFCDT